MSDISEREMMEELNRCMDHLESESGHQEILDRMNRINYPSDIPIPKFVLDSSGVCPNWIRPIDQMSFGVEIECYDVEGHQVSFGDYFEDDPEGSVFPSFLPPFVRKGIENHWKVKEDGSLDSMDCGREFISPVLYGSEGVSNVCKVMDILRRKNFFVDSSCGIHIHVGISGIVGNNKVDDQVSFLSRLVKMMFNYQGSFFGSCGEVRRDRGIYSCPLRVGEEIISLINDVSLKSKGSKSMDDFSRVVRSSSKYRCLNISKLRNSSCGKNPSSSIEFRYPEGSLNKESFLLHLVQIMWLIRQSWLDRHNRQGRDKVCDNWILDRKFQKKNNREGIESFRSVSKKIQNSPLGKWLKYENENLFHSWEDLFQLWENQSVKFDENFNQ